MHARTHARTHHKASIKKDLEDHKASIKKDLEDHKASSKKENKKLERQLKRQWEELADHGRSINALVSTCSAHTALEVGLGIEAFFWTGDKTRTLTEEPGWCPDLSCARISRCTCPSFLPSFLPSCK
jgi:hypothetical protein